MTGKPHASRCDAESPLGQSPATWAESAPLPPPLLRSTGACPHTLGPETAARLPFLRLQHSGLGFQKLFPDQIHSPQRSVTSPFHSHLRLSFRQRHCIISEHFLVPGMMTFPSWFIFCLPLLYTNLSQACTLHSQLWSLHAQLWTMHSQLDTLH